MILLVTGSRSLADTPAAERWARGELGRVMAAELSLTRLVVGDAYGPDAWAKEIALDTAGAIMDVWFAIGPRWVFDTDPPTRTWWNADGRPRVDPFGRNRAMVAHVAATYPRPDVRVLALFAPWSRTHGTGHTVVLARRAGLAVEERVCPAEHGPRGEQG